MKGLAGWIVVRTLLLADAALLVVAGFISLLWVQRPGGPMIAGGMWLGAGLLLGLLPLTDPYRVQARRYRRDRDRVPVQPLSGRPTMADEAEEWLKQQ
jgi:hypothetical protein